jgi:hypothetical protein
MQCYYVAPLQPLPISQASLYEIINVQTDINVWIMYTYVCIMYIYIIIDVQININTCMYVCMYVCTYYVCKCVYTYAMLLCGSTTVSTHIKCFTINVMSCHHYNHNNYYQWKYNNEKVYRILHN